MKSVKKNQYSSRSQRLTMFGELRMLVTTSLEKECGTKSRFSNLIFNI